MRVWVCTRDEDAYVKHEASMSEEGPAYCYFTTTIDHYRDCGWYVKEGWSERTGDIV